MSIKRIGIAIVEDAGRFLVGVRTEGQVLAGCAEFPGGKCEPDETPAACAERECWEETGLHVRAIQLLDQRQFAYPHATVDLHFWLCQRIDASEQPLHGFQWVDRAALASLPFPAANQHIVQLLTEA